MNQEIRGKRIILREQTETDASFYAYWFSQPQIMFQCGFEKPVDEEEMKTVINVNHKSEDSLWFTITDFEGNLIGETGLLRMFPAWHQTDLTIIIPDPKMQSQGYGTEAIRLMLDLAFETYGMHRVSIGVVGLNTEALRFYERIGFKKEGILEEAYYYNNEYSDFVMMRLLSYEWKQQKEQAMTEDTAGEDI
ncbi:MAG: GNAT family N-acetyltransferase [Solobacterium sp.]|nr:GNAT family N-acetyltransferase [Solobacterium sp.]